MIPVTPTRIWHWLHQLFIEKLPTPVDVCVDSAEVSVPDGTDEKFIQNILSMIFDMLRIQRRIIVNYSRED